MVQTFNAHSFRMGSILFVSCGVCPIAVTLNVGVSPFGGFLVVRAACMIFLWCAARTQFWVCFTNCSSTACLKLCAEEHCFSERGFSDSSFSSNMFSMSVRFRAVMFCFVVSVLLSTGVGGLVRFVSDSVCGVSGVENVLSSLDELVSDGDVVSLLLVFPLLTLF